MDWLFLACKCHFSSRTSQLESISYKQQLHSFDTLQLFASVFSSVVNLVLKQITHAH